MFSVSVFYDERIVVVAEQRPDASEEDSFQWMSRVLQVSAPIGDCVCTCCEGTHTFSPSTQREKRKITVSLRLALSTE